MSIPSANAAIPPRTVDNMTLRDYFMAHAPALPQAVLSDFIKGKEQDEAWKKTPRWNEGWLEAIAYQEARWRKTYADAMLKARAHNATT